MEVVHSDEEVRWVGANFTTGRGTIGDLPYESGGTDDKANYETAEDTLQCKYSVKLVRQTGQVRCVSNQEASRALTISLVRYQNMHRM